MKVTRLLFGIAIITLSGCYSLNSGIIPHPETSLKDVNTYLSKQVVEQKAINKSSDISFSVLSGNIKGDTTYRIDFPEGASQLEFPLGNSLLGLGFNLKQLIPTTTKHRDGFSLRWWLSQDNESSGKLKDSDWLDDTADITEVGQAHPGLDIYSESTAKLSARIIDVNYVYTVMPGGKISIGIVFGYLYQNFHYNIYDVTQVGFGPYAAHYTDSVSGKVLDYEVTYSTPYLGLTTDVLLFETVRLNFQWGYSAMAEAKDTDKHVLRYKISKGDTNGTANIINLNLEWEIQSQWSLQLNIVNMSIDASGKQSQYWYGNDPVTAGDDTGTFVKGINDKISSTQKIVAMGIRYRF